MDLIAEQDIHRAYGFITLPNLASIDLHQRLGFRLVGKFDEVGKKFGKYHKYCFVSEEILGFTIQTVIRTADNRSGNV